MNLFFFFFSSIFDGRLTRHAEPIGHVRAPLHLFNMVMSRFGCFSLTRPFRVEGDGGGWRGVGGAQIIIALSVFVVTLLLHFDFEGDT